MLAKCTACGKEFEAKNSHGRSYRTCSHECAWRRSTGAYKRPYWLETAEEARFYTQAEHVEAVAETRFIMRDLV